MVESFIQWIVNTVGQFGYPGIIVLMAIESSLIPLPSEVVMIPAGYLAFQGKLNLLAAIGCGTFGSFLGGAANYLIAYYAGRTFFIRLERWRLGFRMQQLEWVERFFARHGEITTFIGRLLPVARHLISLPAGLGRMNFLRFSLYTSLGAAIWVTILVLLGYYLGENEALIRHYSREIMLLLLIGCALIAAVYIALNRRSRYQRVSLSANAKNSHQ